MRDTNFKVEDKVRIRSWKDMLREFGFSDINKTSIKARCSFTVDMKHLCGRTAIIKKIENDGSSLVVLRNWSDDHDTYWSISTDMIEKVEENQMIITYRDGNKVISNLKINGKIVKTAEAKCCPTDIFDFNVGAKLSLDRLFEENLKEDIYIKLLGDGGFTFNKRGDVLKAYKKPNDNKAYVLSKDQIRSVGSAVSTEWVYLPSEYKILKNYVPQEVKVKAGDYIKLTTQTYAFNQIGDILKVDEVIENGTVSVLSKDHPRTTFDGNWYYLKSGYEILKDYTPKAPKRNKGEDLIGRKIEEGTRFKVINVDPHKSDYDNYVCVDEYVGKIGIFNDTFTFTKDGFHCFSTAFEEDYIEAIDKKNGTLRWRYDEVEILD